MADRSRDSRSHRKQQGHRGSQTCASSTTGQSHASSMYRGYDPYASPSRHDDPASGPTRSDSTAGQTLSGFYRMSSDKGFTDQRYYEVPRNWTSPAAERERVLNHPALAYSYSHTSTQNHDYGSHAAQAYQQPSERLLENLHGHYQRTQQSSAMMRWAQQTQQEESWNGTGSVRKRSEYDPYNTKL